MIARAIRGFVSAIVFGMASQALAEPPHPAYPWPPDPSLYASPGTEVAPGLAIGDVLGKANADSAQGLLPPEVLEHYREGDYENEVVSWPRGIVHYERSFVAATKANEDRYDVDSETAAIIDKRTGRVAAGIYGIPFPTLRKDDPEAGIKALWNQFHAYWNQGTIHNETLIVWASNHGVDRQSTQLLDFQFYENQSPQYRVPNPRDFLWQFIATTRSPTDLQGTVALTYRHRDPKKRDSVWAYVPALRRVRPVSPANRSDGFLGSDLSEDDGNFFDGKPEDFVWKTVGLRDGLRIVDPDSIRGKGDPVVWIDSGGWHNAWPRKGQPIGYMTPGWKGLSWAPAGLGLAKRRFWVVEGVPRDKYYLYGRVELWIDAEAWTGAFNRKFSWKGEILNTYGVTGYINHPVTRAGSSEVEWLSSSVHAWQCAENVKLNRATLGGIRSRPDAPFERRVTHDIDRLFSLQNLQRLGK